MRTGNQGIFPVELECFESHRRKTYIRSPRHFQIGKSLFPEGVVGAIVASWQSFPPPALASRQSISVLMPKRKLPLATVWQVEMPAV